MSSTRFGDDVEEYIAAVPASLLPTTITGVEVEEIVAAVPES